MAKKAKRQTARSKNKHSGSKEPGKGLAFIDAKYQRKMCRDPDLKSELKARRQPHDVMGLVALYDAYTAAAKLIMVATNQPRAEDIRELLDCEWSYLLSKAWTVAEYLKTIRPSGYSREAFVHTLVDCAFEMSGNADDAASVLREAMGVGVSP
jgi:hypothetical protein